MVDINTRVAEVSGVAPDTADTEEAVTDSTEATEEVAEAETGDENVEEEGDSLTDETEEPEQIGMLEDDSTGNDLLADSDTSSLSEDEQVAKFRRENPLFAVLSPPQGESIDPSSPVVGYSLISDTAKVNDLLKMEEVKDVIPDNMRFAWSAKPYNNVLMLLALKETNEDGTPALSGEKVTQARVDFDERNQALVNMTMNAEGAVEWARITEANVGRCVAIVLDNMVYSFPNVNGKISGGRSQIMGDFTPEEAQDLSNLLKAGKLPAPAQIEGEDVVGPALGANNIRKGLFSFLIAFLLTIVFMGFYYNKAGLVANIALIANLIFILGCSAAFSIVLTLPGMAAIILTVGMAVDANVLIFERIREELKKEKTLKASIRDGFNNAFSSVMDANITTFLTGVVLYAFGIGPIKGFAVALMIGIVTSLISALIITRLIMDSYANRGRDMVFGFPFTTGLFDTIKMKMVERRKTFYIVSGVLVLVSVLSFGINGFKTGVDFDGGRQVVMQFERDGWNGLTDNDVEAIRAELGEAFEGNEPVIKTLSSSYQLQITTNFKKDDREATDEVLKLMQTGIGNAGFGDKNPIVASSTDVGPIIARDIKRAAFLAVLFSLLIIFLYILLRFRKWQYSVGAIAAIFHDVIIVLGLYSILGQLNLPFNLEINQAIIAALLTIIGYSINDTVVVFDRIRENINEMKSGLLPDIYNISIDQTISRTLITSVTTFLTALILFVFGGDVLRGFIFAILIGVVVGTYSSIFVASPISLDLIRAQEGEEVQEDEKPKAGLKKNKKKR